MGCLGINSGVQLRLLLDDLRNDMVVELFDHFFIFTMFLIHKLLLCFVPRLFYYQFHPHPIY